MKNLRFLEKLSIVIALAAMQLCVPFGDGTSAASEARIYRHGISFFSELNYPPGFSHFDFVNPDAPKGGTFSATKANSPAERRCEGMGSPAPSFT